MKIDQCVTAMPYRCIQRIIVRKIVRQGNASLNALDSSKSLANWLSPRNAIDNLPHIHYNDLKYRFSEYVQPHVIKAFMNNMKSRTVGAIVLGPRKIQAQYNFMSLETGTEINGRVIVQLPITS